MGKAMRPVDFMRVKAAQNKNKTTMEICKLYGYGRTTVDYMKRCKTFKEYKQRFCGSKKSNKQPVRHTREMNGDIESSSAVSILMASVAAAIFFFIMLLILGVF